MRAIRTDQAPAPVAGAPYSQAIEAAGRSRTLFVSGQVPVDPSTGALVDGGIQEQTRRVLDNVRAVLEAGGASMQDVVKTTVYMTDLGAFGAMNDVYAAAFGGHAPARATVQVAALPLGAQVEIDAIAVVPDDDED
jgi:2-iminobutanoate/2-iminopropanoate deaminase